MSLGERTTSTAARFSPTSETNLCSASPPPSSSRRGQALPPPPSTHFLRTLSHSALVTVREKQEEEEEATPPPSKREEWGSSSRALFFGLTKWSSLVRSSETERTIPRTPPGSDFQGAFLLWAFPLASRDFESILQWKEKVKSYLAFVDMDIDKPKVRTHLAEDTLHFILKYTGVQSKDVWQSSTTASIRCSSPEAGAARAPRDTCGTVHCTQIDPGSLDS